jgi:hypothetical protein
VSWSIRQATYSTSFAASAGCNRPGRRDSSASADVRRLVPSVRVRSISSP